LSAESIDFDLADISEAYAVQSLVAEKRGRVGAWKTGAASPDAEPIAAPIFADLVHESGVDLPAAQFHRLGIEAEIAYRLEHDLPPQDSPYTRMDIVAAIDAILPAIEIVDSRCEACDQLDPLWKLADNQINGGLVCGKAVQAWQDIPVTTQAAILQVNGQTVVSSESGHPAGDPLRLLVWMANHMARHCGGLRRGQIVTTGSFTGLRFMAPGDRIVADFPGISRVSVSFAAS
jgi:2-keto-4-pentenoate hydratase